MSFFVLLTIFQKTLIFWFVNFIIGLPLTYFLTKKNKDISFGFTQLIGISVLTICVSWINFLKIKIPPTFVFFIFLFIDFVFFVVHLFFDLKNKNSFPKILNDFTYLLKQDFLQLLIYVIFILVLVSPQKTFPPFIPSYEVNHDPIVILNIAKNMEEFSKPGLNYPLGFSLILNFYHLIINIDYYNLAHFVNILLYSLSIIPLFLFFKKYILKKFNLIIFLGVFFGLLSYFPVQYVNQSFYGTISLTPFLFISIYYFFQLCESKMWSDYFIFILFFSVGISMYSLTIFLWIVPLILAFIFLELFFNKHFFEIKKVFISISLFCILNLSHLWQSIELFYKSIFVNQPGSENSFFGALGNTPNYPSVLIAFSSWFSNDFRFNDTIQTRIYSWLFFIVLIIFASSAIFLLQRYFKKNFVKKYLFLFSFFVLPMVISYFVLQSPYYFTKTLFYFSILVMSFLCIIIFLFFFKIKKYFLYPLGILIFLILLYNSHKSINYFGHPPIDKFLQIQEMAVYLKNLNVVDLLVIDNEDWLNYFLFDTKPCIVFARAAFSCGANRIKLTDDGHIELGNEKYYLIGDKYMEKVLPTNSYYIVPINKYYTLFKKV